MPRSRDQSGSLGLTEVVAMGVGGMVSGGIYAVLGVAMKQAGNAVPISYLLAGIITLLTAYSYVKLTLYYGENGGVFTFIEHGVDNVHLAALSGWVLILGYIGVTAMYAFAFGAYSLTAARALFDVVLPQFLRPVISVGIVALFVGLNLSGVEETGLFEDIAVYVKIVVLLSLAGLGITFYDGNFSALNLFDRGYLSPIAGFAIIFVSYEGFQLITYDYNDIQSVEQNLPLGMYLAIFIAILIYVSVSFMAALQLTPEQLVAHEEIALAEAVNRIPYLEGIGFILVILSALKSTSSGINATLFGASRLAHRVATEEVLPRVFSFRDSRGIPVYSLVIMGILTSIFTAVGSLKTITEFGSVAFLLADAAANYTGLATVGETGANPLVPALGLGGTLVALPILVHHLYVHQLNVLLGIGGLFLLLVGLEWLYMRRIPVEEYLPVDL